MPKWVSKVPLGPLQSNNSSRICGTFTIIHQESADDLLPISIPEVSDESKEEFKEEEFLDAETGLMIKPSDENYEYVKSTTEKYMFDQFKKNSFHLQHEEK